MAYKQDWFEGATDSFEAIHGKDTMITFKFPNAAVDPKEFTVWLYKHDEHGLITETNQAALMLQCFVDAVFEGQIEPKTRSGE